MKQLSLLIEQQSIPAKNLVEPAPSAEELDHILQCAMTAPDHGQLQPFRFLIIQGDARYELSSVFEQAVKTRNPQAEESVIVKQKNKPLRSPMIIVVIARVEENPAIPQIEQILSAGCAAQHIQLACSALGYGSIWLTGDNCYDMSVNEALGLEINERLIGFIYVGTPDNKFPEKDRKKAATVTSSWESPQQSDFAI